MHSTRLNIRSFFFPPIREIGPIQTLPSQKHPDLSGLLALICFPQYLSLFFPVNRWRYALDKSSAALN
jgi:hypothetical protein